MTNKFCFGTLAVGSRYRKHARLLASDVEKNAPHASLIILTDKPDDFKEYSNAIVFKHDLQSVVGFHDKLFVFKKALITYDVCMFLDADIRILGSVPPDMEWLPGITARYGCNILENSSRKGQKKAVPIIKSVSQKLNIDLDKTQRFHEFMFTIKKQSGAEIEFLNLWQMLAYFFELQGVYNGSGNVMGLAARKSGLQIRFDADDRFPFFKDNIESIRINTGQSNREDTRNYFEQTRRIEFSENSSVKKHIRKLTRKISRFYRLLKLKYLAKRNPSFQRFLQL